MWLSRFTDYLLKHRLRALVLTFVSTFIPVVGTTIGILIAAFVTLRKGVVEGAIFTLVASLVYVIAYIAGNQAADATLVFWSAVSIAVAISGNILTWAFAVMLFRNTSWSLIFQIAALVGVLVISVIHLVYPDVTDWWGVQLQALLSYYDQATIKAGGLKLPASSAEMQLEAINITKQYMTGILASLVLLMAVSQLAIARWWQSRVYMPGTLRKELHGIRLSYLAGGLFLLSIVLAYMGNGVVLDMMPVLYMLFCAAGLSLIHYLFGLMTSPTRWLWLAVLYLTLIFSPLIGLLSIVFVAMFALLDIWLDVRKRVSKV